MSVSIGPCLYPSVAARPRRSLLLSQAARQRHHSGMHKLAMTLTLMGAVVVGLSSPAAAFDGGALSAGGDHTCAIKADGTVRCWGNNDLGQSTPPADLGPVKAVTAGG